MNKQINSLLPMSIEVQDFDIWGRYTLKLNKITLRSKSQVPLKVGQKYLAQLSMDSGRLTFSTLLPYPDIYPFEEGLELLQKLLISDETSWYKPFIIKQLLLAKTSSQYNHFKNMLYACLDGVFHLPFLLDDKRCLAQLKCEENKLSFYLFMPPFGPLLLEERGGISSVYTPFSKVKSFLEKRGLFMKQSSGVRELFTKLLDYKG